MDISSLLNEIDLLCTNAPELAEKLLAIKQNIGSLAQENEILCKERDQYQTYVENASDTIATFDLDGVMTFTSRNWTRQLGHQTETFVNKRIFEELFHPDDQKAARDFLQAAIDTGTKQQGIIYRIMHKDGSWRWHTANLSPIFDDSGKVISVLAIARSIHDQRVAELAVRASEARFRTLLNTMREGVLMVDNDDTIQYVNPYLCDMFGFSQEEVIGKKGFDCLIVPEDHNTILKKNLQRQQGIVDEYELRGHRCDGEIIWLHISGAPMYGDNGKVIGSVGVMTDITQQKMMVEALRSSEEKYRLIFENSITGVFRSTMDDQYISVNNAFAKMFGFQNPEEMMKEVTNIRGQLYVNPSDRDRLKELLLAQGKVENFQVELLKNDGKRFWCALYACLSTTRDGRISILGTSLDITESRSLQEQLIASQKMEAIGKLAGGVAHDFNNLLTVILGYSEDIIEGLSVEDPLREPAEEIMKAGVRAASLTRQLLAFSRKQVVNTRELNFNSILNNLHSIITRTTGENIAVEYHLADDLLLVKAHPGQTEQIIINLVVNAKDAMPLGGRLKLQTENVDIDQEYAGCHASVMPGKYVMLMVSDSGSGIDKSIQNRVFEPFFTTKEMGKGLGLGLSTVYGIVKQSNGHILLYSEPGQGTSIKVLLPALQDAYINSVQPNLDATLKGKGEQILVVEDEEALCHLVHRMLSNIGYQIKSTSSPLNALKMINEGFRPDLILSDVVMPDMNGKDLADNILKILPKQKIVFMSGFSEDVIAKHGILGTEIPLVQKPFSAMDIAPVIQKVLAHRAEKLNILIMDDEEAIRTLLIRACHKRGHKCIGVAKVSEALEVLAENKISLILMDMNLGYVSGPEALEKIRTAGFRMPAIVLSGMVQPLLEKQLHHLGVVKAFEKSFDNNPLLDYIEGNIVD